MFTAIRSRQVLGGAALPRPFDVASASSPSKEDEVTVCVICKRPIDAGKGRFRTEKGDAHEECYKRTQRGR